MNADPLDRLAELAGIEEGWWDFFGQYRHVSADTKRAFLTAMGFSVTSDEEVRRSLSEFEERPWRRWLEPVMVVREDAGPPTIAVTVPDHHEDDHLHWTLEEEEGAIHQGEVRPRELEMIGERVVDDELRRRHLLPLPMPLPVGIHNLRLTTPDGINANITVISAPRRAYQPAQMEGEGRLWGYATQLYALRGPRDWGVGDFTDLAGLVRQSAAQGAAAIGINPLHALFPSRPERFSPYSPSSRLFLNVAYIDVEAVPDFAESQSAQDLYASDDFQKRLREARGAALIEYVTVGELKLAVLRLCWESFRLQHLGEEETERGAAFRAFQRAGGMKAERFATFEALQDFFLRSDPPRAYWRHWPEEYQDPAGAAVAGFALHNRPQVELFWYLQWLADEQLKAAQAACCEAGMPIGLYRDLGVGIAGDGAEAWANQRLLCLGVSVGAPPDPLNLAGQDWGLVPFNPVALREAAYRPFLAVLDANMTHAGAMRLDHAMSLQRLYWVPAGASADQGAYVRYPIDDLFGIVTLASRRKKCLVIGEDLGTVPEGFRDRLRESGIFGYRLMVFEKVDDRFKTPEEMPSDAVIAFGTHDLPSLIGWWRGTDIAWRQRLSLYPRQGMGDREAEERSLDRQRLVHALVEAGLLEADFPTAAEIDPGSLDRLSAALYAYMDRSPCRLLMVQFEDVLGLALQMNLPGTTDQHPNWRGRYPMEIEVMLNDHRLAAVAARLAGRAPRS